MKKTFLLSLLCLCAIITFSQSNVGIGTATPANSSLLDLTSTDKGLLVPRLTTIQRTAIVSPAEALMVFDTDSGCFYYYHSSQWNSLCNSSSAWLTNGNSVTAQNYFGTNNLQDIHIHTNNGTGGFNSQAQKMIVTANGCVGIGQTDANGTPPIYPLNKLLVQNGTNLYPYYFGNNNIPPDTVFPNQICAIFTSLMPRGNNLAASCTSISMDSSFNYGCSANAFGDNGANYGLVGTAIGHNNKWFVPNQPERYNSGVRGDASGNNCINFGILGLIRDASFGSINRAVYGSTWVDGDENYGVVGDLSWGGNATLRYSVMGIQASAGSGQNPTTGPVVAGVDYAGYFNGDVFCSNTYYYSDPSLKNNVAPYSGALESINSIKVSSYSFRQAQYPGMVFPQGEQVGILSSDLKRVFPLLVKRTIHPSTLKTPQVEFEAVNYNALIPVLVKAIQELDLKMQEIELLKRQLQQLQQKVDMLSTNTNNQLPVIGSKP